MDRFEEFLGKTLVAVSGTEQDESMQFEFSDGSVYIMYHQQECCEGVWIEDICGDLQKLIGYPLTMADEYCEFGDEVDGYSSTYTFYKLANVKEYVTIRWYGESNGYYSESVDIKRIK